MAGFIKKSWEKFVDWMDLPPSKPKPGVADVHWEFLGDVLGELASLTDTEIEQFSKTDFSTPKRQEDLVKKWVLPTFERLTENSRTRILHTIDYHLLSKHPKIDWVLPSFGISVPIPAHHLFHAIRLNLPGFPMPKTYDPTKYHENRRQTFSNTLFSAWESKGYYSGNPDTDSTGKAFPPLPERQGLFLPSNLNRHHSDIDLALFKRWCSTGETPDGVKGLPIDAVRWRTGLDIEAMHQMGASRFANQYGEPVGVKRLTLRFKRAVGEGFTAHHPDQLIEAFHVRFIIDRFGYLVRCYPIIRI